MRPAIRRRISLAVYMGLVATLLSMSAWVATESRANLNLPRLILGGAIVAGMLWIPLAPLAKLAARKLNQVTLIDTVLLVIVLLLLLQILFFFAATQGSNGKQIDGEACNRGDGRKLVTPGSGQAIYWACVPVADYESRLKARDSAHPPASARSGMSNEERLRRLVELRVVFRSVVFGTVGAVAGWLFAFGWCLRARPSEL